MSLEEELNLFKHYYGLAKKQNDELLLKISRQTEQLALVQNGGRAKNEEMKKLKEELKRSRETVAPLQRLVDELQADRLENLRVISNLRQQNGDLGREKRALDNKRFHEMGRIEKLRNTVEEEKRRGVETQRRLEEEKGKIREDYKKEVKYLEDSLKQANEHVKYLNGELQKRVDHTSLTHVINDLHDKLTANKDYIEFLKEKKNEDEMKMNKMIQKERLFEVSVKNLNSKLNAIEEENARILLELNTLKEGNKRDLDDRTCLICHSEMQESEREFQTLPKCTTCKRRYHGHCISQWFVEKIECPTCREDGLRMENISRLNNWNQLENVHL